MSVRQMKDKFEAVYREALETKSADASRIVERANTLVQAYNAALLFAVQAGAERLGVEELKEIPGMDNQDSVKLGFERVEQVCANINRALISLGFPIYQDPQPQK